MTTESTRHDWPALLAHDPRCTIWNSDDTTYCDCRDQDGHAARTWIEGPLLAFDLESTSPSPFEARIVTATLISIAPGRPTTATNWLTDVGGEEIPDGAAKIHGVTTEHAREHGRPIAEVVTEIRETIELGWSLGTPLVGHNIGGYDINLLAAECERLGLDPFKVTGPVVDTITIDRAVNRRYGKGAHTLGLTCAAYGIELTAEDAHSSDADALASARVAWKLAHRYPAVRDMSLDDLQAWQAEQHRKFAEDLGAYFTRVGKVDDVSRDWPMRGAS